MTELTSTSVRPQPGWRYWGLLAAAVLAVKLLVYRLDPTLLYFLGDSQSYLYTSLTGWIPSDRSWMYGRWLRAVTFGNQTLDTIVLAQMLLSVGSCLMAAYVLTRFVRASRWLAALAALLCAVEPLQLMYERFVMAETISLFFFGLFLIGALAYVERGRAEALFLAALAGAAAITLRSAYGPAAFGAGLVAVFVVMWWGSVDARAAGSVVRTRSRIGLGLVHLLLFVVTLMSVAANDPQRQEATEDGFFLLTAWSPVLAREDFPQDDPLLVKFLGEMDPGCELDTVLYRDSQQWLSPCLCGRIRDNWPNDPIRANRYARNVAQRILHDYPLDVLDLGRRTWLVTWDDKAMERVLLYDRGALMPYQDLFIDLMQENYSVDVTDLNQWITPTGEYYEASKPWMRWVALSPLALLLWVLLTWRRLRSTSLVIAAASGALLVVVTIPITVPSMRFYHGIAWLSVIGLAALLDGVLHRRRG